MGISRQQWKPGIQNDLGAPSQLQYGEPRMTGSDAAPAGATGPVGATPGQPARAVRRRGAAALVAAAAAASVLAVPAGAASARPLPGDYPNPACRVDVRAVRLPGGIVNHLFIIYHGQGRYDYFRGGPDRHASGASSSSSSSSNNSPRRIVTEYGPYKPGTIDYDPEAHTITVLQGAAACGKNRCFTTEARRINSHRYVYASLGPNSNSVAHTLLVKCHVPVGAADLFRAPGFDKVL